MNSLKVKQVVAAAWLAVGLIFGSGIITAQLGFDIIPTTHACGLGSSGGGGCA